MKTDYHVHSCFSDGKHSPEEIILSAIDKKMQVLGFSDHSYTFFDEEVCENMKEQSEYVKNIRALSKKYNDKIAVLCGIEQDYYSQKPTEVFDYIIGSVHYINVAENYYAVDDTPQKIIDAANKYFDGDLMSVCERYFELVGDLKQKTGADIIGHFDLISKFNQDDRLFDSNNPRYVSAWKKAADKLLKQNVLFEINTGAISRGYKTTPYPSQEMIKYIDEKGGKFILSSDSHDKETLMFNFDALLKNSLIFSLDRAEKL